MNLKELKVWLSFIIPPIVAVAIAYGSIQSRLTAMEKQQDRNTELIIQILRDK